MRTIITTIGTSLLTNGVSEELKKLLSETANFKEDEMEPEQISKIKDRVREIQSKLSGADITAVKRMSAELNGVLTYIDPEGGETYSHYLLYTDTFQGELAVKIVSEWLQEHGTPQAISIKLEGLSTRDRSAFAKGIDFLLGFCDNTLPELKRQNHRIIFNLVGGFKSLQAYAQTIGMIYADEIIYIFEGAGSKLITIPRLPIQFEIEKLKSHAATITRMAQTSEPISSSELQDLPEAYLEIADDLAALSAWGKLAWNQNRREILGGDLLQQPGLAYEEGFRRDYKGCQNENDRVALQETLAKVSSLWKEGGLGKLRADRGLQYEQLARHPGIDHFRDNLGRRVSCEVQGRHLHLRHYGSHDYVNNKP